MRNANPLLIAVPSFLLGGLLVATLTTTASARAPKAPGEEYVSVTNTVDLNRVAAQGYEYVGQSSAAPRDSSSVETRYTLRRKH